jgi:hypothetical protein
MRRNPCQRDDDKEDDDEEVREAIEHPAAPTG